tara:strand:+ start:1084 stop:1305 length:222 start_codon:yes stop_codon:yes gene_type:complete
MNPLLEKCVGLLRREDVQREIKKAVSPLVGAATEELYPYIQICLLLILVSFIMQAATLILIFKSRKRATETFS